MIKTSALNRPDREVAARLEISAIKHFCWNPT